MQVNSDDIKKHRRDIVLLVAARTETEPVSVPVSILECLFRGFGNGKAVSLLVDEDSRAIINVNHIT